MSSGPLSFSDKAKALLTKGKEQVKKTTQKVKAKVAKVVAAGPLSAGKDILKNPLSAVKDTVSSAASSVGDQVDKAATSAAAAAIGFKGDQADKFSDIVKSQGGITSAVSKLDSAKNWIAGFFSGIVLWMKERPWVAAGIGLVLVAVIVLIVLGSMGYLTPSKQADPEEVANTLSASNAKAATAKESPTEKVVLTLDGKPVSGFANGGSDVPIAATKEDTTFINAQPLTIKQAGYLGPPEKGLFDPEKATGQALKAGFRAFVLQIDYLTTEKDKENFPEAGVPTLLYRGDNGQLISANAGSIEKVAQTIASLAFRPESPAHMMPVILYLHVLRAPSPTRQLEEHLRFMSRIARALNPLAPFHLGSTPMGTFHRQKGEATILNTPLKSFEGQVIVLSNMDTTLFRTPSTDGKRYDPADDLDYWVNMRVSLTSEADALGVTKMPETGTGGAMGAGASAVVVWLSDIIGMSQQKKDAFATKGKARFVIAMPGAMANPTPAEVDVALRELGVNMVPLDIFGGAIEDTKKLVAEYSNQTYSAKPAALQNIVNAK